MSDTDLDVSIHGHVALLEIQRPPNNFFDETLITDLAEQFEALDENRDVRVLILAAAGKHFCAGANFASPARNPDQRREQPADDAGNPLYEAAVRLFACRKPVIGAIQGAAIGGGFGLAVMPDFRVVTPAARFAANFVKLGFHPGFGLTYTLPKLIGIQRAARMFMTGERIDGETALAWGLADRLTSPEKLRDEAFAMAQEIAENAPLAIESVRATLRAGIADAVKAQTDHENREQNRLRRTNDHKEGVKAVAERRPGNFTGT
jgi:enoyl-CoA hydratase/carnithine racemase